MIDVLGTLTESGLDLHTSIVLTYSVDLVLYDSLIRRRFRQAGAVNQMVFCDLRKYQEQLDGLSVLRRFGRSYSVTPVHQAAAFHPKLYMLLGRKGGRLVIGSGNATIGGLFRNAEAFGVFEYDRGRDPGPHPAFRECFQFVEQLSRDGAEVVKRQVARARSWSLAGNHAGSRSSDRSFRWAGSAGDPGASRDRDRRERRPQRPRVYRVRGSSAGGITRTCGTD